MGESLNAYPFVFTLNFRFWSRAKHFESPLAITGVAVEKVRSSENRVSLDDRKCISGRRKSFIGHPSAPIFQHDLCERVFSQQRADALIKPCFLPHVGSRYPTCFRIHTFWNSRIE